MDDLAQWLGGQLAEDERIVRENSNDRGLANGFPDYRSYWDSDTAAADEYIDHFGPVRMLREIEARRQLLNDYVVTARIRDEAATRIKAAGDNPDAKDLGTWDRAQREAAILEGPVRLAASPLADRPGYRDEWRP